MTTETVREAAPSKTDQLLQSYLLAASAGADFETTFADPANFAFKPSEVPLFQTYSSGRMRANLFIDLAQHGIAVADGLAINRAWAWIFTRLAARGASHLDSNQQRVSVVKGYPHFLLPSLPEAGEELVLRKWCKSAEAVREIAKCGYLQATHSGLNLYNEDFIPFVQYPDVTGVVLADPKARPQDIGWHDMSRHYIDVVFEGASILHTFHPQKFVAPLPARIRDKAWENAIAGVQYLTEASDRDSDLMRMVRHQVTKAPVVPLRFARIAGSSIGGFVESAGNGPESGVRGEGEGSAARAALTSFTSAMAVKASAWNLSFSPAFVPANLALTGVRS